MTKGIGYSAEDYKTDYGLFFNPEMAPVPPHVNYAVENSPFPAGSIPPVTAARIMQEPGYGDLENGYTLEDDGSIHVAVLTDMPNVRPEMWDWWFGWHGCKSDRYKLWHPKAHIEAKWEDGLTDHSYLGRVSIVDEYIGKELIKGRIRFRQPTEFGFSPEAIKNPAEAVYICAVIGHPTFPIDFGYLLHQIRITENGSEMRSRFWIGGKNIKIRSTGFYTKFLNDFLRRYQSASELFAKDLLLHCAEEMNHLAGFLPALYAQINKTTNEELHISGKVIRNTAPDFQEIVMSTLFNKVNPGRRPFRIVEPSNIQDIIETIKYAKSQGKKISVCSGGHSFSANHVRDNSILIKMSQFNSYEIDKDAMTAKAGPAVGGSILMTELFKQELFFPAGHCKGVCIGGYLLQGGYGWNGRKTGMACESVIGLDLVTADGELIHASAHENADMFWAARGSGAGFFGVVVCFHLKLFELPKYRSIIVHDFYMKHLEHVYQWAYEVGPTIPKAVEFQMIMSNKMSHIFGPGIEAFAPIFADTKDEYEEAIQFMVKSPIKSKALIATPAINPGISALYAGVASHYPENSFWGVDNMWTHASIDTLMPYIKEISRTLPPAPSHFLWLNWHPNLQRPDMAYSNEDKIYLALYGVWKKSEDTAIFGDWATNMMQKMSHLSTGIQLADENLHKRPAKFLSDENKQKLKEIKNERDPHGLFHEWHSSI